MKNLELMNDWDHVDVDGDTVRLYNEAYPGQTLEMDLDEILDQFETEIVYHDTMEYNGWDYQLSSEKHIITPRKRWEEDKTDMILEVWGSVEMTWIDGDGEILKVQKP